MNIQLQINHFKAQFKLHADPKRAEGEKRYMKSSLNFHGVNVPTRRKIVKTWIKNHQDYSIDNVVKLASSLWSNRWYEEKSAAINLLSLRPHQLTLKHMPLVEKMINQAKGWGHLDEIAIHLVGALIDNDPQTLKYLPKWAKSNNFWVRRAALLSQILQFRRRQGNKQLFFKLAIPMLSEKKNRSKEERFFIRKAIGWVLREIAQVEPLVTFNFIRQHKQKISGLTFREGSRKLPPKLQKLLSKS